MGRNISFDYYGKDGHGSNKHNKNGSDKVVDAGEVVRLLFYW